MSDQFQSGAPSMRETAPTDQRIGEIEGRLLDEDGMSGGTFRVNHVPPDDVRWLIAELRAAQKDSERLAMLRDWAAGSRYGVTIYATGPWQVWAASEMLARGKTLDEALDAARSSSLSSEPRNGTDAAERAIVSNSLQVAGERARRELNLDASASSPSEPKNGA